MAYVQRKRPINVKCPFCEVKTQPQYGNPRELKTYMTEKGKIIARNRSGLCLSHQKALAQSIKRARHLALLPYVTILR